MVEITVAISIFFMGVLCGLLGVIYRNLNFRISRLEIAYEDLSSIKTDLEWIKKKLNN